MDSIASYEVRLQTLEAIRGYEQTIRHFKDLMSGTLTGEIPLHLLHLPHLYKEIEDIRQLSQELGLIIPTTQHILHLPKTIQFYNGGVDIILTIPPQDHTILQWWSRYHTNHPTNSSSL